jgi:hypothetical protein
MIWNVPLEHTGCGSFTVHSCYLAYLHGVESRVLCKRVIVPEVVKKFPAFYWNPKVHCRVHGSPPLEPVERYGNPVHTAKPSL